MSYSLLKLLHIVSVVVFLGNIMTGLFWAAHARRSRNFAFIAATFEGIVRSDRLFTLPAVLGIIASGVGAALVADFSLLRTGWILWPIVLFTLSGIAFGRQVAPLQRQLVELTRSMENSDESWSLFEALYRKWELWGLFAIATPVAALVIMVLKPSLPGI